MMLTKKMFPSLFLFKGATAYIKQGGNLQPCAVKGLHGYKSQIVQDGEVIKNKSL